MGGCSLQADWGEYCVSLYVCIIMESRHCNQCTQRVMYENMKTKGGQTNMVTPTGDYSLSLSNHSYLRITEHDMDLQ